MELFRFTYQQHHFAITGSGWDDHEQVDIDGECVSRKPRGGITSSHFFSVAGVGDVELAFVIDIPHARIAYHLRLADEVLTSDTLPLPAHYSMAASPTDMRAGSDSTLINSAAGDSAPAPQQKHWVVMLGVVFKLLKTAKVFKAALVAASVSVYSVMFTFEFAIALVAILVFHEYGHLRAMKRFGIPTKGMYLIPFVGGLAVGDKPHSRWQDIYISLMGPVFGLIMTVVFYIAYLITGGHFVGLVASTSALINLFNLLPVYPLDGGRVVKSLVFSGRKKIALVLLLFISALCTVGAFKFGFALIGFFIVLGVLDIVSEWRISLAEDITPLNRYGIWFCLLWYLAVLAAFLVIIVLIAQSGLPGSEIALKILNS